MTLVRLARAASTIGAIGLGLLLREALADARDLEQHVRALAGDVNAIAAVQDRHERDLEDLVVAAVPIRHEALEPLLARRPLALQRRRDLLRRALQS